MSSSTTLVQKNYNSTTDSTEIEQLVKHWNLTQRLLKILSRYFGNA